jgi:DNA-binding beta-propeller fold protein YncE
MFKRALLAVALATTFSSTVLADPLALSFSKQWTHTHLSTGQVSEITAYDKMTHTLWVAGVVGVDVLDATDGSLIEHIDVTPYGFINSVAIHDGLAAFAIESVGDRRNPGLVLFYDTRSRQPSEGVQSVEVGALPDMLAFSGEGDKLLVANEGTPNVAADLPYGLPDPAGSVTIIDIRGRQRAVVATPELSGVPTSGSALRLPEVTGMDYEPEYIAIDKNGKKAYVTLQEANGIAVLDLKKKAFTQIIGLGLKDFSLADNGFGSNNFIDPSDKDKLVALRAANVKGLYQPDSIAAYRYRDNTYLVMANEGDTREDDGDKARVKDTGYSSDADLQRLNISTIDSSTDNLVTFGGRSFSIRDSAGSLVYDSGSRLDAEAMARGIYDDGRSDDKGVEPEGVTLLEIEDRTFAFIGLERTTKAAVAVFDITNPRKVAFVDMIVTDGDKAPEGLATFRHQGETYLVIANEVSNTTTLYRVDVSENED